MTPPKRAGFARFWVVGVGPFPCGSFRVVPLLFPRGGVGVFVLRGLVREAPSH